MPSTAKLSQDQRAVLADLLRSRLAGLKADRAAQLHGLTQAESARQTRLQDADDARQRAGAHEVEGIVADIDSAEFTALRDALRRIQDADFGLCIGCGTAIPFDRLQLEPQALRCAACQTLYERNPSP